MLEAKDIGPVAAHRAGGGLADLFPGYFALIMTTGITPGPHHHAQSCAGMHHGPHQRA